MRRYRMTVRIETHFAASWHERYFREGFVLLNWVALATGDYEVLC